jgi:septal ring factor EnvC (AmiA/AmiB activator)
MPVRRSRRFSIAGLTLLVLVASAPLARGETAAELQESIKQRQQRIEELRRQAQAYEQGLAQKRRERQSLANEVALLTDRIAKASLEIATTEAVIDKTTLEIKSLETLIGEREAQLAALRDELAGLVRWYARAQDRDVLRIVFAHASFADFYDDLKTLRVVQANLLGLVREVTALKEQLGEA